jgi:hypothetical protein
VSALDKAHPKVLELDNRWNDQEFERRWLAAKPECVQLSLAWNSASAIHHLWEVQQ